MKTLYKEWFTFYILSQLAVKAEGVTTEIFSYETHI